MSNRFFNTVRFLSEVAITACGALYLALSKIWGWPYGDAVVATCAAVSTFLGIFTEWQRYRFNSAKENKDEEDISESQ